MNIKELKYLLSPLYKGQDAASRLDQADRVYRWTQEWLSQDAKLRADVDEDVLIALCFCLTLRKTIVQAVATRSQIEAYLVGQGWAPLKIRELMRSLERLPDSPKSVEEKLVADGDSLTRLGTLGLVRQVLLCCSAGQSLSDSLAAIHKNLARRLHTSYAQADAVKLREELRLAFSCLQKQLAP